MSSTSGYRPLHSVEAARRTILLRIVLLLVIVFFLLFCVLGYTYQPQQRYRTSQRRPPPPEYNFTDISEDGDVEDRLQVLLNCHSKPQSYQLESRGGYYVLKNFFTPNRSEPVNCYETITYTTHGDYTFLDNLVPLVERWQAPVSVALFAPSDDLEKTVTTIQYLLHCLPQSGLIRDFVSFHPYFAFEHVPDNPIHSYRQRLESVPFACRNASGLPYAGSPTYRSRHNLTYPVNVGRNVARTAAATHFVLASDIELYPNPGFVTMFLEMIASQRYRDVLRSYAVFVLPVFEVSKSSPVPETKDELLQALTRKEAIKFHEKICSLCHTVPGYDRWLKAPNGSDTMGILATAKRTGDFHHWEPIYVGTNRDPLYDERLNWEGKSDKMTQGYILCTLDYNFHVLDNGFLVHRPGFKSYSEAVRPELESKQRSFILNTISQELTSLYGKRAGCVL